jgi:PRTRC genetic system protein E
MFADLHALAQSATLLIAVSADGDALRVSVTPTTFDPKKAHALRPMVLVGTPAELDADFGAAVIAWQAPRKSLVEQAQAAAGAADDDGAEMPAAATADQAKASAKAKPGPKRKDAAPAAPAKPAEKIEPAIEEAHKPVAPEFELTAPPVETPTAGSEIPEPPPPPAPAAAPVVDTATIDMF